MVEFIRQNWSLIAGVAAAAVSTGIVGFAVAWLRLRFKGSRRVTRNWQKTLETFGDKSLLYLGTKRVNPDTIEAEGDAASIYYQKFTSYMYEVHDGIRYCFIRSFVVEVYAFYQWETERRLGDNLMTQFASAPYPCMGLQERQDAAGAAYWVKVPVEDVFVGKQPLSDMVIPDQKAA